MTAPEKKAAPKKAAKPETNCRGKWSLCGGKEKSVSASWHLGPACTAKYREMKKAEQAAKPATPKAAKTPRSAGSSPKAVKPTKRVAKNSGGGTRRSVPPVQLHPAPVPVVRVNAPEQAPALVQLVAQG